jgi:hypothetical protein
MWVVDRSAPFSPLRDCAAAVLARRPMRRLSHRLNDWKAG